MAIFTRAAIVIAISLSVVSCSTMKSPETVPTRDVLLAGEVMGVAYSGFREGQHPDRGSGAVNPTDDQILEDLTILVAHGFRLIRLYDEYRSNKGPAR